MPSWRARRRNSPATSKASGEELAQIYVKRGVEPSWLARSRVQLMAKDALGAHARDELGISEITTARPVQAALTSAATFAAGAAMPLLAAVVSPAGMIIPVVTTGLARHPCGTRRRRRQGRWSQHLARCGARRLLGRLRHGAHGRHRRARRRTNLAAHRSILGTCCTELQIPTPCLKSSRTAISPAARLASFASGELVHAAGYGFADIEQGVRIDADTVFNIASTSKQVTAFALLLLARDGQLALDDSVRKFVPELPATPMP